MYVFDQFGESAPALVDRYHRWRRRLVENGLVGVPEDIGAYTAACGALKAEVLRRGGSWRVGRLVYEADHRGLWVTALPGRAETDDELAARAEEQLLGRYRR